MDGRWKEEDWRLGAEMWAGTGPEQVGTGADFEVTSRYDHTRRAKKSCGWVGGWVGVQHKRNKQNKNGTNSAIIL